MSVPVRYYCPRCETVVTLQRAERLADKSVTPFPLEGWRYVGPGESFEGEEADGVRFVCGETPEEGDPDEAGIDWDGPGCGEPFYLNFVRFEAGREVDPVPEREYVRLAEGAGPTGPRGPEGPPGPRGPPGSG
jgi:hypothetical protein